MRVLTVPRDDKNPYQGLLHDALGRAGVDTGFVPRRTRSHSANLLLLPLELALARRRGADLLHLHWVYGFGLPWGAGRTWTRRLSRVWFGAVLRAARLLGLPVVWTAHNELPHHPVFPDDVEARRRLLRSTAAVIVHSTGAERALRARGWQLPPVHVIRHGPLDAPMGTSGDGPAAVPTAGGDRGRGRRRHDVPQGARLVALLGRVEPYKGIAELLDAVEDLTDRDWPAGLHLLIAGECLDRGLQQRLRAVADRVPGLRLDLRHLNDLELADALAAADAMVLPFRRVTTSGSALLAVSAGVPLLLTGADHLDLPAGAVHRHPELTALLRWAAEVPEDRLRRMSRAGTTWAAGWTWDDVARCTAKVYDEAVCREGVS